MATSPLDARDPSRAPVEPAKRLEAVSAVLTQPLSIREIGEIIVQQGLSAVGAYGGGLLLRDGDDVLTVARRGYPTAVSDVYLRFPLDTPVMVADCIRTGEPSYIADPAEMAQRYPQMPLQSETQAWAALPLVVDGLVLGGLTFSFDQPRRFAPDERSFLGALADECARAIRRTGLVAQLAQAQASQEETQALLNAIVTETPMAVAFFDADVRYLLANDTLATLHRMPAAAHVGRTLDEVAPRFAPLMSQHILHVFDSGEPIVDEILDDAAAGRSWLCQYFPVRTAGGHVFACGVTAVDVTARRHAERERAAAIDALYRVLLPETLPDVDGVDLAARYRPASGRVGGDVYDVWQLPGTPHRLAVLVADVVGHGAAAGAVAAMLRHAVRTAYAAEPAPEVAAAAAGGALESIADVETVAALTTAVVEVRDDGMVVQLLCLGGPHPLVRRAGGRVERLPVSGPILGIGCPTAQSRPVFLHPGDALVLMTDGVTEARTVDDVHVDLLGDDAVEVLLKQLPGPDAAQIASAIDSAVVSHTGGQMQDDLALLVLRAAAAAG